MKKTTFLICLFVSFNSIAQLQSLYAKLDANAGYSILTKKIDRINYGVNSSISLTAEPKIWVNNEVVIGLKLGINLLQSRIEQVTFSPIKTIMFVGEKYFGEDDAEFKLFAGGSAGLLLGGQKKTTNGYSSNLKDTQSWGIVPRGGFQYGPYRLMAEYNIRKKDFKFLSLMIGYTFGGGE